MGVQRASFGFRIPEVPFFSGGGRAIVQYAGNKAIQYQALFPSESFLKLSRYLIKTYGAPSENPRIWTHTLGAPKQLNRTLRWRTPSIEGSSNEVLEIRSINDLRWSGLPQLDYGVIRLYYEGTKTVFESVSVSDLMMMQIKGTKSN